MKKQAPLKASIRQPIRTLIFALMVGLASFGFVARVVEFRILSAEMNRLAGFYRTIGSLVPINPTTHNNVYEAAQLISGSPFVAAEDRRAIVQGVMDGVRSAVTEFYTVGGNSLEPGENPFAYKDLHPFDSFMVIEIERSFRRYAFITGTQDIFETHTLAFNIVETLHGHEQFRVGQRVMADFRVDENGNSIADHLRTRGQYLIRATNPNSRDFRLAADIFPIIDGIYFVSMNDEEMLAHVWEALADELTVLHENSHMLMLTGTRDMTALPFIQNGVYERFQGRLLTYDDYINANPVIVIPQWMEGRRAAARVGETITITLRDMRTFVDGAPLPPWGLSPDLEGLWRNLPAGYWTAIPRSYGGDWQSYPTITLELEVVGTYSLGGFSLPRWRHISGSYQNMEAFIPASLIPDGWGIVDAHIVSGAYSFVLRSANDIDSFTATYGARLEQLGFTVQFFGPDARNFYASVMPIRHSIMLNLVLFSLVLVVVLALTVCLYLKQRYKEFAIMRALGITQGSAIWQVFVPVLLFWLPVVIAASIAAWYFALEQASSGLLTLFELDTPTDYSQVVMRMNILVRARWEAVQAEVAATPVISPLYLAVLCAVLVTAWTMAVLGGVMVFARQSMLSLIQRSQGAGAPVKAATEGEMPSTFDVATVAKGLSKRTTSTAIGKAQAARRHHVRHIRRSPVKTLLVVGLAGLFIVAMGWLNVTIHFTAQEIERLYATTPVSGEIIDPRAVALGGRMGHDIPLQSLNIIRNSEFVESYYYTRMRFQEFLLIPSHLGELEDRLRNVRGVSGVWAVSDWVVEINNWDAFVWEASRPIAFGAELQAEFEYTFALGFDASDFVKRDDFIPIILHESYLNRWLPFHEAGVFGWDNIGSVEPEWVEVSMNLGDRIRIAQRENYAFYREAVIIGTYTGGHPNAAFVWEMGLVLMPSTTPDVIQEQIINDTPETDTFFPFTAILEFIPEMFVSTLQFDISPSMSRYLAEFEEDIANRLIFSEFYNRFTGIQMEFTEVQHRHQLLIDDAELTLVIMPLEENLNLLRLLYPMVIALSFVLSLGLCLIIMLQNTKNAAIMRVLGTSRYKTRLHLILELIAVCFVGLFVGLAAVLIMGVILPQALLIAGVYLAGAVVGSIVGAIVITTKTPLDLLQVRE